MALQPAPTNLATAYDTYTYQGCYLDNDAYTPAFRVLNANGYAATDTNTIETCIDACRRLKYAYAVLVR
ncbi:hypothetical protein LTR70_006492 [Exophiala xenobiotica]|uniref:Uncharacterized protein n=1 Tax=Lithohypha guttulata TaxID=1690604 RepID=A0ABR0JY60_9EURO|nr:hypothetical protein LTR24_009090 [Lithohypha guttulata]KAK5315940.1 hypothetical protein LTR70_006492 [Exophiala xenobiotica]